MFRLRRGGFVRWVVMVSALLSLFAVSIRGHRKLSQGKNETAAIASLRSISEAMEEWSAGRNSHSYADASLSELAQSYPRYIDGELGKGMKEGYTFTLLPVSDYEYFCLATPLSQGITGTRIFRITASGIVEEKVAERWHPVENDRR